MMRSGRTSANTRDIASRSRMSSAMVLELAAGLPEVAEGPGRVAAGAEEVGPHVVVDPVDLRPASIEMSDGLGADQPAASGDEDFHRADLSSRMSNRSGSVRDGLGVRDAGRGRGADALGPGGSTWPPSSRSAGRRGVGRPAQRAERSRTGATLVTTIQ